MVFGPANEPVAVGDSLPRPVPEGGYVVSRAFKVFRSDVDPEQGGCGFTARCNGCTAILNGQSPQSHSSACRQRVKDHLLSTDAGRARVERAQQRPHRRPRNPTGVTDAGAQPVEIQNPVEDDEELQYSPSGPIEDNIPPQDDDMLDAIEAAIERERNMISGKSCLKENVFYKEISNVHVAEVYSPPRVTRLAPRLGLNPGFAFDLSENDPEDGRPWDFTQSAKRERALRRLMQDKP